MMFRSGKLFSSLLSKAVAGNHRKPATPRPRRTRPQLEYLEARIVPAVIDVTSLADTAGPGTLAAAFQQANTNGQTSNTIDITLAGTYNIGQVGALQVFANATATQSGLSLTVQNTSGGNVAISGDNLTRVFDINPKVATPGNNVVLGAVTINGVTIENGLASDAANPDGPNASGGGIRDQGPVDLTLNNDIITNNSATADGGGVSMENTANTKWKLTLNNTTVINNHAGDAGGGVEEDGTGIVNINNSTIANNTCLNQGAGVWLDAVKLGTAALTVTNSVISGNTAGMLGGGIGNSGSGAVSILDSTIENNFTPGFGGGFADQNNNVGTLAVQNSLFLNNSAGTNGGGIQEGNLLTITNSEIKGNSAGINGSMPIGTHGSGNANLIMGSGGGLFVNGGVLTLTNSTIADNTATINGGGMELVTTAPSTIKNSTITGNTVLNNAGGTNGGGIDDTSTSTLALIDDTITGNFAVFGGGVADRGVNQATGLTLQNTILAQNLASTSGPDFYAPTNPTGVDLGGNLIGIGNSTIFNSGTTQQGTAANPLNPQLAALANNGGSVAGATGTQMIVETEALLPGSPAIGKGVSNGITIDERGFSRVTTLDVGAFQFEDATLNVTISASSSVGLNANEQITVTVTNTSNNPLPADNGVLVVNTTGGLNLGGTQTVTLGALGAGQSANFTFNASATALGTATITATVTTADSNPLTVSTSATVTVSQPPPPPPPAPIVHTPIGALTLFGFGFGPTGIDLFEVDTQGEVFAETFGFGGANGAPQYVAADAIFSNLSLMNGAIVGDIHGSNGQPFLMEVLNFSDPFVFQGLVNAILGR